MRGQNVVVGAGPAGLEAARVLADGGEDVIILEKSREEDLGKKPCAGIVFDRTEQYRYTNDLISDDIYYDTLKEFVFACGNSEAHFLNDRGICRLLNRKTLAKRQLKMAEKAGAQFIPSSKVKAVDLKNNTVKMEGKDIAYDTLIGADGSTSVVRRALGIKTESVIAFQYISETRYDAPLMVYFDPKNIGWYAWHVPHPHFSLVGCGTFYRIHTTYEARRGLEKMSKIHGFDLRGEYQAAPINISYEGYKFRNVYLVGDAGGFTPISGEGIALATYSGHLIAEEILGADISKEIGIFRQIWMMNRLFYKSAPFMRGIVSSDLTGNAMEAVLRLMDIRPLNLFIYKHLVNRIFGGFLFI